MGVLVTCSELGGAEYGEALLSVNAHIRFYISIPGPTPLHFDPDSPDNKHVKIQVGQVCFTESSAGRVNQTTIDLISF